MRFASACCIQEYRISKHFGIAYISRESFNYLNTYGIFEKMEICAYTGISGFTTGYEQFTVLGPKNILNRYELFNAYLILLRKRCSQSNNNL
jgi:hypothetical protein